MKQVSKNKKGRVLLVTGAVGYVGEMLCEQLVLRKDVKRVVAIDKEPCSKRLSKLKKLTYLHHNLADDGWEEVVAKYMPDTVIHTAWQIREMYGKRDVQWRLNIESSKRVFEFCYANSFVKKVIYFSTAACYSARVDNTLDHYFSEEEGLRDDEYSYAYEKKVSEEALLARDNVASVAQTHRPQVTIFRPSAITGPRGRFLRIRFGLQSALSGSIKGGFVNNLVSMLTMFMPVTKSWVRQFVHEDDVYDVIVKCVFEDQDWQYETFNLTPLGEPVYAKDMAKAVGKRAILISPFMVRVAFFIFWHLTRGKIPTCAHSWRFYSHPILMSGEKLSGFYTCQYGSMEAFKYTTGRYEKEIPKDKKVRYIDK